MGHHGKLPFTFTCPTAKPHWPRCGGRGGSQRAGGIALPKNWDKSLFQEDPGANVIML